MQYIYFLPTASLTLRVIDYVDKMPFLQSASLTIIHQLEGWIIRIKSVLPLTKTQDENVRAFLSELGCYFVPEIRLEMVFWSLDIGDSPIEVMRNYHIAIVSHGKPNLSTIESFRQEFIRGLGYQPETFA